MPLLHLSPPSIADAAELLAFELSNREFFESNINARPVDYYSLDGVHSAIAAASEAARAGAEFQYIVRDESNTLVARVNLTRVRRNHFHSAELGYRVAKSYAGRGIATEAVRQILFLAFSEHRLVRIEATARAENIGSVRVLERNAFTQFGRALRSFELNGNWYDLLHFERHADA